MANDAYGAAEGESPPAWPSAATAWFTVAVLLLAYTLSYIDRSVLTVLVEPIQADLHINDTQIALLHGLAFVIFYVSLGIPLGYIADRSIRRWLIVGSITLWSLMTAACGLSRSFGQLFAMRVGVGVGEAGLSPASYSVIADCFPPSRRSVALGLYGMGIYLGSAAALLGGGALIDVVGARPSVGIAFLGQIKSWQLVFLVIGAPGLLVALLAMLIREPPRRLDRTPPAKRAIATDLLETGRQIARHPTAYGLHSLGFAFLGVPFNVTLLWARPYLTRHFGLTPADGAYLVGFAMLVCPTLGIAIGSRMADHMQAGGRTDATVRVGLVAALALLAPVLALPFMPTLGGAVTVIAVILFFGAFAYGAAPAALQLITPNRMRALTSAIYLLLVNLVGLSAGPLVTGVLTDYVFHDHEAVGYSAAIVCVASVMIAAVAFLMLLKPYRRAVAALPAAAPLSPSL